MKGPRFTSALRSVLGYFGEGLTWMGFMWMCPPFGMVGTVPEETSAEAECGAGMETRPDPVRVIPDRLLTAPLSRAECAEWAALRAVRGGQVHAVDANGCFSRPGPRLVDGIERLAAIFHGENFAASSV